MKCFRAGARIMQLDNLHASKLQWDDGAAAVLQGVQQGWAAQGCCTGCGTDGSGAGGRRARQQTRQNGY